MGSKAPLSSTRSPHKPKDDKNESVVLPDRSPARLRLHRIADALRVPESALYHPPNAITQVRKAESDCPESYLDQGCEALLHAYRRIADPAERQRLLSLVQAAAEQG